MHAYLAVAIGGALGACCRFGLGEFILHLCGKSFPFATLLVNILGSFVLGLLYGLFLAEHLTVNPWKTLIGVGF